MLPPLPHQDPGSAGPRQRDEDWMSLAEWQSRHQALKERAKLGAVDLLLLGDSITEAWPTTGQAAFEKHLLPLKAAAFGIGGDMTQHLLWRLRLGECEGLAPKAIGLLIGINNFGHQNDSPAEVARGVLALVGELRRRWPQAKVLLIGLLPDGDSPQAPERLRVSEANRLLAAHPFGAPVTFLDVSNEFLLGKGLLNRTLLPDGVHPNAEGYERLAQRLEPLFRSQMGL